MATLTPAADQGQTYTQQTPSAQQATVKSRDAFKTRRNIAILIAVAGFAIGAVGTYYAFKTQTPNRLNGLIGFGCGAPMGIAAFSSLTAMYYQHLANKVDAQLEQTGLRTQHIS